MRSGDKLLWKQKQSVSYGGVYFFTTDSGGTTGWTLKDQNGEYGNDSMQTDGNWHSRVVDLSSFAGKTISQVNLVAEGNSPAGNWIEEFSDIAVVSSDGTVRPIYNGATAVSASPWGTSGYSQAAIGVQSPTATAGETVFCQGDQLGSARVLTSDGGWPISTDTFYPFGLEQVGTTDPNHYKYAGLDRDYESGFDHATFRTLANLQGRWSSPDPYDGSYDASNPQSLNRYAYVLNNPLSLTDPTGQCPFCFGFTYWAGDTLKVFSFEPNPVTLVAAGAAIAALGIDELGKWLGWWGGPQFHGSLKPRPNAPSNGKSCNDANNDRSRFFQQKPGVDAMAQQLNVPSDYLNGLSSYESGWLNDHNLALNNMWGLTQAGGNNLSFPSIPAGNAYFVNRVGPFIQNAQTLPAFFSGLQKEGYNAVNPHYYSDLSSRINNMPKWEAACGVQ